MPKLYLKITPSPPSPAPAQSTTESTETILGGASHSGFSTSGSSGVVIELEATPESSNNRETSGGGTGCQVPTIIGLAPAFAGPSRVRMTALRLTYGQRCSNNSGGGAVLQYVGLFAFLYRPGVGNVGEMWSDGGAVAWDPSSYESTTFNYQFRRFTAGAGVGFVDVLADDRLCVEIWFKRPPTGPGSDGIIYGGIDEGFVLNTSIDFGTPPVSPDMFPASFLEYELEEDTGGGGGGLDQEKRYIYGVANTPTRIANRRKVSARYYSPVPEFKYGAVISPTQIAQRRQHFGTSPRPKKR